MSRPLALGAVGLAAAGVVALGGQAQERDAWAPEPAHLTAPLSNTTGSVAAAYYVVSHQPTTAVRWGKDFASFRPGAVYAGQPCSTTGLTEDSVTTQAIQIVRTQARCF